MQVRVEGQAAKPEQSQVPAVLGCLLSRELEPWESGFEGKKQERVRVRRLLCALVRRDARAVWTRGRALWGGSPELRVSRLGSQELGTWGSG